MILFCIFILISLFAAFQSIFAAINDKSKNKFFSYLNKIPLINLFYNRFLLKKSVKKLIEILFPLVVFVYTVSDKILSDRSDIEKQKEISRLEKAANGRSLTRRQIEKVTNIIKERHVPPLKVTIYVTVCPDCQKFSHEIGQSLKNAGWDVKIGSFMPIGPNTSSYGISLTVNENNSSVQAFAEGMKEIGFFPLDGIIGKADEGRDLSIFIYSSYEK